MGNLVNTMMQLIANRVCGRELEKEAEAPTGKKLDALYRLSQHHDLAHLVGDALLNNGLLTDEIYRKKFEKRIMVAVLRYERLQNELNRIYATLSAAAVPFIPLKGSVLRRYYPEPWMRTSCDIDILVKPEDLEKTVALLSEKLSYQFMSDGEYDVTMEMPGGLHVEIHYSLIERKKHGAMDEVLQDVWNSARQEKGTSAYLLSDEVNYYYHIAHMAKHLSGKGCGVRPLIDLWILNHVLPHDREKRLALLKTGGLDTFAAYAEQLSEVWFGTAEHTDVTRCMQDFIIRGGVYGSGRNRIILRQIRSGGRRKYAISRIKYAISRIWLPYDALKSYYSSLEGKKVLLPFYEVRRWFRLLFCGGLKRSGKELKLNSTVTDEQRIAVQKMFAALKLEIKR